MVLMRYLLTNLRIPLSLRSIFVVLAFGLLVSCGPVNQNDSAVDDEGSVSTGDVEPGPDGEPVVEEDDRDNDSLMQQDTPNEDIDSPTDDSSED